MTRGCAMVATVAMALCAVVLAGCGEEERAGAASADRETPRNNETRGGSGAPGDRSALDETPAARFDRFAREVFQDVYPSLAGQILSDYGVREGLCLDLGCGPGYLGIELATRSKLSVIGVDIDPDAVAIAQANVLARDLADRVSIEEGDVHGLRFADDSADLIVSRGSFPFWKNPAQAFREIRRVLKPDGIAFIGGGMGRALTREQRAAIKARLDEVDFFSEGKRVITPVMMQEILESAGVADYKIISDGPVDSGCPCAMWVEIRDTSP